MKLITLSKLKALVQEVLKEKKIFFLHSTKNVQYEYIVHLSQNLKHLGELLCHETYYIVKAQGLSPRHGHHQWWSLDSWTGKSGGQQNMKWKWRGGRLVSCQR